jgi:alginate O-acetyltransferase complex protein AlgI
VYIPLGGNRRFQVRNLFIVWGLTGLWHGASWNFVGWGLYFFLLLFLEKKWLGRLLEKIPAVFGHLYALFVVLIGWVFFYFTNPGDILHMLRLMFGFTQQAGWTFRTELLLRENILFFFVAFVASTPVISGFARVLKRRYKQYPLSGSKTIRPVYLTLSSLANVLLLFASTATLVGSTYNPFLYFRF